MFDAGLCCKTCRWRVGGKGQPVAPRSRATLWMARVTAIWRSAGDAVQKYVPSLSRDDATLPPRACRTL